MTITEFLEARIAEDETAAREIADCESHDPAGQGYVGTIMEMEGSRRYGVIAVDPARVLAECAAKRAILKEHDLDLHMSEPYCDTCAEWWKCELGEGPPQVKYPCPTIRTLAAIYKDHPDYRQEAWG